MSFDSIYAPQIPGHLRLAAKCTHDFLKDHYLPSGHFDDFFGVAQQAICPYLQDDCETLSIDPGLVWDHIWGRLTTHHQRLKLLHIPPTTRARMVERGEEPKDPQFDHDYDFNLRPTDSKFDALEILDFIKTHDPEFLEARYNGSSRPNHPQDAAARLGIPLHQFEKRQKELERKVYEAFEKIPRPSGYRCACPPESEVAPEEGAAHAA